MLEALFPELLDKVLAHLELPDLYSIRLTSRHLERESTQTFAAAAFSQLRVDLSAENLRWIHRVASHDRLRLAVRSLWCGDWGGRITAPKQRPHGPYGTNGHWPRMVDGRVNRRCELVRQFVHSLSRFANCASVTVTDERLATRGPAGKGPERDLSSADVVDIVLHALAAPAAPSPRRFQTRIAGGNDWGTLGHITRAAVSGAEGHLAGLEELTLELDVGTADSCANMLHLLAAAPRVRILRVQLCNTTFFNNNPATEWILTRHLDSIPQFTPALDTLLIYSKAISTASLLRLLSGSRDSLTRLDVSARLDGGSWAAILTHLREATFRKLRRFSMRACRDGPRGDLVAFCPLWKDREALEGSLGIRLWFRVGRAEIEPPGSFHIIGVMFEANGEDVAARTGAALKAMVEYSHRGPRGVDERPCARLMDMRYGTRCVDGDGDVHQLWTGLPCSRRY